MESTNERTRNFSTNENASTAMRCDGVDAARKTTMKAWAGIAVVVLLFLAIAQASVMIADAGSAARAGIPPGSSVDPAGTNSGSSAAPTDYFPSRYVNNGRDGDGNVMTYEHD